MKRLLIMILFVAACAVVQGQDTIHLQAPTPCSSISNIVTQPNTGVEFSIFPNPSAGIFHLRIKTVDNLGLLNLSVTTLQGATVYQTQFYASGKELQTSLNLSNLSNGHYLVTLSNKQITLTEKLVLQK